MSKYRIRRILFSVFSLLVVVMLVMLLVYSLIERSVIFQTDDTWNKKSNNDRVIYEYTQYQKYGYLTYVDYSSFLKNKYQAKLGESYTADKDYIRDKNAILDADTYIFLTDHSGVGESHLEPTIGDYNVKKLNDLLVNVINEYCK